MKRLLSAVMILLVVLSTFLVFAPQTNAILAAIFQDDFEAYPVGSFPSAGGWELVWNGKGTQYQIVTDSFSLSPVKSLQLLGRPSWSANVQRKFASTAQRIGFEAYVRTDSNTGTGWKIAGVCFWNLESEVPWGKRFADIAFGPDGELYTRPVKGSSSYIPLGLTYEGDRWYKVRVIINRIAETYDVWIDDILVAEDIVIWDIYEINALMLESGHSEVKAYFDDITVFEGSLPEVAPATLDINPNALNLRSKGKWITGYIELPEGYDVADIDVSSILLNDTIPVDPDAPTVIGDYDEDGIPDLMVKFDRAEVTSYILANVNMTQLIEERFMTTTLTITGKLNDDTPFQGSDTIRIMKPPPRRGGVRDALLK